MGLISGVNITRTAQEDYKQEYKQKYYFLIYNENEWI
jgi:hypothetical protein